MTEMSAVLLRKLYIIPRFTAFLPTAKTFAVSVCIVMKANQKGNFRLVHTPYSAVARLVFNSFFLDAF